jgi:ribosomal protein L37E
MSDSFDAPTDSNTLEGYSSLIKDPTICHYCNESGLAIAISHCPHCGFPQSSNVKEQREFIYKKKDEELATDENKKRITTARWTLFAIAGITAAIQAISWNLGTKSSEETFVAGVTVGIAAIFFTLGIFIEMRPRLFTILALSLYTLILLINIWEWMQTGVGLPIGLLDIIILGVLGNAVRASFKLPSNKRKHGLEDVLDKV